MLSQTCVANTDADSRVPLDWLTTMLTEADRGAHLVLGTVLPTEDLGPIFITSRAGRRPAEVVAWPGPRAIATWSRGPVSRL